MPGILYVVATPIGNLQDMTERGIETLKNVDLIAAEDTRNTLKLLNHFDIHTPQVSNHKFNEYQTVDSLVAKLLEGKSIAIVSDAGTPCVNDPGYVLVKAASEAGITVVGVSGACAAVTAVSASGLCSDTFRFMGFFPREHKETDELFELIRNSKEDLYIFYESPKRIKETISLIKEELPTAKLSLCNDLTKAHERIYRGSPEEVLSELMGNPNAEKGEYCLTMYYEPVIVEEKEDELSLEALLTDCMVKTGCSLKEAIKNLSGRKDILAGKNEIYAASLKLKDLFGGRD